MKNLFVSFALLVSVLGVSCKKGNEAKPETASTPAVVKTINVEYRMVTPSADANADFIAPNANGVLEMQHVVLDRNSSSTKFTCPTGNFLSVSAANNTPSHIVVQVQILVDGVVVAENSSTNPSQNAIASGNF